MWLAKLKDFLQILTPNSKPFLVFSCKYSIRSVLIFNQYSLNIIHSYGLIWENKNNFWWNNINSYPREEYWTRIEKKYDGFSSAADIKSVDRVRSNKQWTT